MGSRNGILAAALLAAALPGTAQVASNASLTGRYNFRHVLLASDGAANTRTGFGIITFDGNGGYTATGQQLVGTAAPVALSTTGTYTVRPGGFVTMANPVRAGLTVNARLGVGALVGSSTEAGATIFDMFVAAPVRNFEPPNGPYWISSFELPDGSLQNIRNAHFKLTANGAGSFTETTIAGQARNLGNLPVTQTAGPFTYAVVPDGTGTLNFPLAAGRDAATQLISGQKTVYVFGGGMAFFGGSTSAGGHGMVVGTYSNGDSWSGFFVAAGLRVDAVRNLPEALTASVGAVNVTPSGSVWARRTRQTDGVFDASVLITHQLTADGSGPLTSTPGRVSVTSTGNAFAQTGFSTLPSTSYELYFGVRMIEQSGTGVFLNPLGVLNGGSYAPPGYPISPGAFVYLYGSGLSAQTARATAFPFPRTLGGVQVTMNGTPVPIYAVSPERIDCVVPFGLTGTTARIVVTSGTTASNAVEVPMSLSAPGIFSLTQNGLGDGAILHANFSGVTAASPAKPGEVVQVYLTGLGAVAPTVIDGAAAPSSPPLALVPGPLRVTVAGQTASVLFQGLAPGLAGVYQLNVQLPASLPPGSHSLAVQTVEGFSDIVNIRVAP